MTFTSVNMKKTEVKYDLLPLIFFPRKKKTAKTEEGTEMWPRVEYEKQKWDCDYDSLQLLSKTRRRKILPTYDAAIPGLISSEPLLLSPDLLQLLGEVQVSVARFDQEQASRGYDLPALMLRSESSSSSQIERLTSSVRNVALAEVCENAPENARLIAGNVAAMREAIALDGPVDVSSICSVHDVLMRGTGEAMGLRREQVWIGGTSFSPHGARFVPPHASRLSEYLDDLVRFGCRQDIDSLSKAAIFHAQFETIHPFTDGNGRTGRVLLHKMLAFDEVLKYSTLPISAGLLHDVEAYMMALDAYHEGEIEPIIRCLANALELAVVVGSKISRNVDGLLENWAGRNSDRKGSASHGLSLLLVGQPVVNAPYVASGLKISERAARTVIETACERGILAKMGNRKRGAYYQASELIAILEEASSLQGIRRLAAR